MTGMDDDSTAAERGLRVREVVTQMAACGFAMGGVAGLALGGTTQLRVLLVLPVGAMLAAVLAGILVNVIALPFLAELFGRRLPGAVYRAAGIIAGAAAFAGGFAQFARPVA